MLVLSCSRIIMMLGEVNAYLAVGGLLASYYLARFFPVKWREDFRAGIEPPSTPLGNGYLCTIAWEFRVISDLNRLDLETLGFRTDYAQKSPQMMLQSERRETESSSSNVLLLFHTTWSRQSHLRWINHKFRRVWESFVEWTRGTFICGKFYITTMVRGNCCVVMYFSFIQAWELYNSMWFGGSREKMSWHPN